MNFIDLSIFDYRLVSFSWFSSIYRFLTVIWYIFHGFHRFIDFWIQFGVHFMISFDLSIFLLSFGIFFVFCIYLSTFYCHLVSFSWYTSIYQLLTIVLCLFHDFHRFINFWLSFGVFFMIFVNLSTFGCHFHDFNIFIEFWLSFEILKKLNSTLLKIIESLICYNFFNNCCTNI